MQVPSSLHHWPAPYMPVSSVEIVASSRRLAASFGAGSDVPSFKRSRARRVSGASSMPSYFIDSCTDWLCQAA